MSLLDSELQRIKFELGYNILTIGAEPYIGITQLFAQVIQPYTQSGATTTATTTVSAATTPAVVALTLDSAVGFSVGDTAIIDADARQESAYVRVVSGSTISVALSLAHSGTYPVTVQGGEALIRGILRKLQDISGLGVAGGGLLDAATAGAGIKKVDEIEFFGGASEGSNAGKAQTDVMLEMQRYWRNELAIALGTPNLREEGPCASGTVSVY